MLLLVITLSTEMKLIKNFLKLLLKYSPKIGQ